MCYAQGAVGVYLLKFGGGVAYLAFGSDWDNFPFAFSTSQF